MEEKWIEVFKAGTWTDSSGKTRKDLDRTASQDAGLGNDAPSVFVTLRGVAAIDSTAWPAAGTATGNFLTTRKISDSYRNWAEVSAPPSPSDDIQGLAMTDAVTRVLLDNSAFLGEAQQDPYLGRYRILKESNAVPTLVNFGRFSIIGSLLFFRESDIIHANRQFFLTFPFNVSVAPRETYVPLSDATRKEVPLTDDLYVAFTVNLVNTDDQHVEIRNAVICMVSSKGAFLFSNGDLSGPNHYLFHRESRKSLGHTWHQYNNQGASVTVEAL